jgi:hypothetical protein
MDSDFEDTESDISQYEESDESEDDDYDNIETNFLWTVQNADEFEFPHEIADFTENNGPVNPPSRNSEPIDYFRWLTTHHDQSIIDILVEETNLYAHQILNSQGDNLKPKSRMREWVDVTAEEMSAFLGLWLFMGMVRKPTIQSYWQENQETWLSNTPSFAKVMRRDRFQLILRCFHANNNLNYVGRGQPNHDPAFKIRKILDLLNRTFKDRYIAARDITVDESMVGHKGRDYTVQYMPAKKSHRWGAKLWVLAESDTGYTLSMDLYAGKIFYHMFTPL